jgi:hypothetical protein
MIDYEIKKGLESNLLTITVLGNKIITCCYTNPTYTDEYVKSHVVASLLHDWLDYEISKIVSVSQENCYKRQ